MSASQAAERLGVSRDTAYKLLADGKIPGQYRVGWQWRVSVAGLEQAMQAQEARNASLLMDRVDRAPFVIGNRVMLVGEVRAVTATKAGKLRYVVEVEGAMYVCKENQLRPVVTDADRTTRAAPQSPQEGH